MCELEARTLNPNCLRYVHPKSKATNLEKSRVLLACFSIHRQDQCATHLKYCQREYYLSIMESGGLGDFEDRQEIFDYADVYARDCYVEDTDFM